MVMRRTWLWLALAAPFILAPRPAAAQLDALRFVEIPPVGSWAEYQVTRRNESLRTVTSQRVAFLSRETVGNQEYYWFQIEMQSDDFGPKRVDMVSQIALRREDAVSGVGLIGKVREMIVQVGSAPPVRIAREFMDVGIQKNLIASGEKGAGSDVEYAYRDLPAEKVKTRAGEFECAHKKGLGKAEVVLSLEDPKRYPGDSILELWYRKDIPFGVVKSVTKLTGKGPQQQQLSQMIDTEETLELHAFGAGATSKIQGKIFDYDPSIATQFKPRD
jgi:hypothetical protein